MKDKKEDILSGWRRSAATSTEYSNQMFSTKSHDFYIKFAKTVSITAWNVEGSVIRISVNACLLPSVKLSEIQKELNLNTADTILSFVVSLHVTFLRSRQFLQRVSKRRLLLIGYNFIQVTEDFWPRPRHWHLIQSNVSPRVIFKSKILR